MDRLDFDLAQRRATGATSRGRQTGRLPYDIFGRTIDGNTVPEFPGDEHPVGRFRREHPVNPNSFVAMPRSGYNIEAEDFHVAFDAGVGSALPRFSRKGRRLPLSIRPAPVGPRTSEPRADRLSGTYGHRASSPTTSKTRPALRLPPSFADPSAMLAPPMGDLSHGYQPSPLPSPAVDVPIRIGDAPTVLGQSPF